MGSWGHATVVDEAGDPIEGVSLQLGHASFLSDDYVTDRDGRVKFDWSWALWGGRHITVARRFREKLVHVDSWPMRIELPRRSRGMGFPSLFDPRWLESTDAGNVPRPELVQILQPGEPVPITFPPKYANAAMRTV